VNGAEKAEHLCEIGRSLLETSGLELLGLGIRGIADFDLDNPATCKRWGNLCESESRRLIRPPSERKALVKAATVLLFGKMIE
jgi:hypothetical protein